MEIDLMHDLASLGLSILIGMFIGVIFDLYRTLRYFSNPKKVLTYIEDLLFWLIIIIIFFVLLVRTTDGILRGFVFIGCFCGGMIYIFLFSKFILTFFIFILKLILEGISEIIKIIIRPISNIYGYSKKRVNKIFMIPKVILKEMGRYTSIIHKKK